LKVTIQLVLALLISVLSFSVQAKIKEVKVGAVFPLTGPIATYGQESVNGMKLALKQLELDPKTKGLISLLVEDNKGDPIDSANAVRKLIDVDKVRVVLGSVASSNTLAGAPIAQKAKVPLLTPASTAEAVTLTGKFVSRICFTDNFQGEVMAKFARETLKAKTALVIIDNSSDYSKGLEKVFKRVFKKLGGQVVDQSFAYQQKDTDFRTLLKRAKRRRPDVIFLPGYYTEAGLILRQAKQMGLNVPFLGGDGWDSPKLFELAGKAAAGNYISSHFAPDDTDPMVQNFVKDYKSTYDSRPGAMAALGYDAILVLADAIARSKTDTPKALSRAINTTKDFTGVTGNITLDKNRNAVKSAVVLRTTEKSFVFKSKVNP
jgi:branched-chain amino acid transport system substrate-binding protein